MPPLIAMKSLIRSLLLCLLMLGSAIAAILLRPSPAVPLDAPVVSLAEQLPKAFGDWRTLEDGSGLVVSPQVERQLEIFYADTLSRTYQNSKGQRVMLSLAFGRIQNRELQVHKPEVCYVAQGFQIKALQKANLPYENQSIPVMRLVAFQGVRNEPITYWIRSGDTIVRGWYEQNKARITAGLQGVVPDGLLVRVSSISPTAEEAYAVQEKFLLDMLNAVPPQHQYMFVGKHASH